LLKFLFYFHKTALPDEYGECDPNKIPKANGKKEGLLSLQGTSMATPSEFINQQ
jgi:hypothetical protein